jgi:uncharacterized repeat protein (TIGR01451 family)
METINTPNSNNKTVLWIAGGCLAVLVCVLAVIFLGLGGLYWVGSQAASEVTVQTDIPAVAQVGDAIEFSIAVTNISTEDVELVGVDISMYFLRGIIIDRTSPPYTETSQFNSVGSDEVYISYYFHQTIAPGETLTLVFFGNAVTGGDFSGDVDVCINSDFNCVSNVARMVIQ